MRAAKGLSLVEVLISLSLTAILLSALAVGVHAGFKSYGENLQISQMTQAARNVVTRISRELRTAEEMSCTSTSVTIIPPVGAGSPDQVRYEYSSGAIQYSRTTAGSTQSYPLLSSTDGVQVTAFTVTPENATDPNGVIYTARVRVRLNLQTNGKDMPISVSVAPRRNQEY